MRQGLIAAESFQTGEQLFCNENKVKIQESVFPLTSQELENQNLFGLKEGSCLTTTQLQVCQQQQSFKNKPHCYFHGDKNHTQWQSPGSGLPQILAVVGKSCTERGNDERRSLLLL